MNDALQAEAMLGDGETHAIDFHDSDWGRVRRTKMRISPASLSKLGLVGRRELEQTPAHGRGVLWGVSALSSPVYGPQYEPEDPFFDRTSADTLVVFDFPEDSDADEILDAVRGQLEVGLGVRIVFLRSFNTGGQGARWRESEKVLAHDYDEVSLVSFPEGTDLDPRTIRFSMPLNILVVDCNLVIRWHSDPLTVLYPGNDGGFPSAVLDALSFAESISDLNSCQVGR